MTGRSGFSLLELLVALALLSAITIGLTAALNLGSRFFVRSVEHDDAATVFLLRTHMRDWLAHAIPPSQIGPFDSSFVGAEDSVEFTTLATLDGLVNASVLRVRIFKDDGRLFVKINVIGPDGASTGTITRRISETPFDPSFSYFGGLTEEPTWKAQWQSDFKLPDLVSISSGSGQIDSWPEFTVRTRSGQ